MLRPATSTMSLRRLAPLCCCVALLFSAPASQAGLFEDDEARKQAAELRKLIDAVAKRVESTAQNQLDFANQIESLRADVARLTGEIEVLVNSLESAHKRQQDFYVDLDSRLRKLESAMTAAAETTSTPPAAAEPKPDPQAEMRDYEAALGLFRESKFKEAQAALEAFITSYPKSTLLPSAHYWLGSSLYQQKAYAQAAAVFGKVAASWPGDPKAPEALSQQANALVGAKDVDGAVKVLETLVEKFPTSAAAETARARIKTLAPKKKR